MTFWYAQNGSQNISDAYSGHPTMWNDTPNGSGNWLTWASLASGDVLCANGKTAINVNVATNVGAAGRLSTVAEVGPNGTGTTGGGFTVAAVVTITGNLVAGTSVCVTTSGSGYTLTIVGNVTGAGAGPTTRYGISNVGAVAVNVTGVVTGGFSAGIRNNSTGNITVTGTGTVVQAGTGTGGYGIYNASTGTVTITGNIVAAASSGVYNASSGNIIAYGDVSGSSSSDTAAGISNSSSGQVTVTGSVFGGAGGVGLRNLSTGTVIVNNGFITADATYINGNAIYADIGVGITLNNCNVINTALSSALNCPFIYNPGPTNYIQYPGPGATTVKVGVEPAIGDIRYGTAIGSNVGTCHVPPAADVLDTAADDAGMGTYHEVTAAEVQAGVAYGPSLGYVGTFAAGGGPLVGEGLVD